MDRAVYKMLVRALMLAFFLMPHVAYAVDRTAASCSLANINTQITEASDGDRIFVPAGNCTWTTFLSVTKDLELIGAGPLALQGTAGGTNITGGSGDTVVFCVNLSLAKTTRLTGFNFLNCTVNGVSTTPVAGKTFRIDHNSFYSTAAWNLNQNSFTGGANCNAPVRHPTGLLDNNLVYNYRFALVRATECLFVQDGPNATQMNQIWSQAPPIGEGSSQVVYLEDNVFTGASDCADYVDGNYGARYVSRFNTIDAPWCPLETHGSGQGFVGDPKRGVQWIEMYGNSHVNRTTGVFGAALLRMAGGMVWGNRIQGSAINSMYMEVNRASDGTCNGTNDADQNTVGQSGWHCHDQVGVIQDVAQYVLGQVWNQILMPVYFWGNHSGAGSTLYGVSIANPTQVQTNRDVFLEGASFDGTSGVGVGLLSARPATCTINTGYWATNQGAWNTSSSNPRGEQQNGADGLFYRCTSTNAWTVAYTPYTYPHPLQNSGGDGTPPSAPTGVYVAQEQGR